MRWLDRVIQGWRINQALEWIAPGDRVLDVGCADGALFKRAPQLAPSVGIDPDLEQSHEQNGHQMIGGTFPDDLPAGEVFDVLTMLAVLEHIPLRRQGLVAKACAQRLRIGGRLVITVPSPQVDAVLAVLRAVRLVDGMSLEQHYGFDPGSTPSIFLPHGFETVTHRRFQLGLNNLYVFRRRPDQPS